MRLTKQLETLFQSQGFTISERVKIIEAEIVLDKKRLPTFESIFSFLSKIPSRDICDLSFTVDNDDFYILSNKYSQSNLDKNYLDFLNISDDYNEITVKLSIHKSISNNTFSIYDFDLFYKDLESISLIDRLELFSMLLEELDYLDFDVFDQDFFLLTNTMSFIPRGQNISHQLVKRNQIINNCRDISYFYNFGDINLLPEDFNILSSSNCDNLEGLFNSISTLLSLIYISTNSSLETNFIKIQIAGQRHIEKKYELNEMRYNAEINKIYFWIYSDSSYVDKALIARNIISLHCKYSDLLFLDGKTFSSIQSNFNLYIKDNVNQYLDLKNKMSEFICDVVSKTGDYAMGMLENFKKNIFAILVFIFTVILANIVSDQPLDNIFTKDITIILEVVVIGSFVYLIISKMEVNYKFKKIHESYQALKENYKDVLADKDIDEIFKDDQLMNKMSKTVSTSANCYFILWVLFLIALLVVIELASTSPFLLNLLKLLQR